MRIVRILLKSMFFILLTVLTQIGGLVWLMSEGIAKPLKWMKIGQRSLLFVSIYSMFSLLIIPQIAPLLGREQIIKTKGIQPVNPVSILLNRNYVSPELNDLLLKVTEDLKGTGIVINYLDANFPCIDGFPLLPHLSHNDGNKIDLSLVYEHPNGTVSEEQKSNSGYGVFVEPKSNEPNQIRTCLEQGFIQYDYPKYLSFGSKNDNLIFSAKGTRQLINSLVTQDNLGKLFIEPHLKARLNVNHPKIKYHGCHAVRHDDHIHIQLK